MRPHLGAHVSAAGGHYRAIEKATELGADTMQIFGASPRQWKANIPPKEDVEKYKEALRKSDVKSVYLHAAYLVNLAGSADVYKKSVDNLSLHFQIASTLGADGLIFHIGASREDTEKARVRIVKGIKEVLQRVKGSTKLVMENASGGGGKIGSSLEELVNLYRGVSSKRVGMCLDTAHAFEAGMLDFTPSQVKTFFDSWEREIGMENLVALHINDSKTKFRSGSDRHENLGEGEIGLDGFVNLAKEKRLIHASWILEVPGFDGMGPDRRNLDILKNCFIS
ncbi:MAG: deoxyribonuclease IV [Candidatus Colwellbacteria bacterium]|nr:deoxyribonuclease IV [Candidatus Colwellbacteria bacterium]